jgi:hypothetical protein
MSNYTTKAYMFHTDPAHGWLQVPLDEVKSLGIQVSAYSYRDDKFAYLEEDCDAPKFMKALGEEVAIYEKHTDNDSFVRNLNQY